MWPNSNSRCAIGNNTRRIRPPECANPAMSERFRRKNGMLKLAVENRMAILSPVSVLRITEAMSTALAVGIQDARTRLASAASPMVPASSNPTAWPLSVGVTRLIWVHLTLRPTSSPVRGCVAGDCSRQRPAGLHGIVPRPGFSYLGYSAAGSGVT